MASAPALRDDQEEEDEYEITDHFCNSNAAESERSEGIEDYGEEVEDMDDFRESMDLTQEQIEELESICAQSETNEVKQAKPKRQFSQKQRVEMIHTRAFLKKLDEKVKERQYEVDKYREENVRCKKRIEELSAEAKRVAEQIATEEASGSMASAFRLRAQLQRVEQEREGEQILEGHIYGSLLQAEYELTLSRIDQGKYLLTDFELKQKEKLYDEFKQEVAVLRQMKERKFANATDAFFRHKEEQLQEWRDKLEMDRAELRRRVKEAHDRHNERLSETIRSIREARQAEENRYREDFDRKVRSVLRLKDAIGNNRENLTSLANRARAEREQAEREADELRHSTLAEGGNAGLALLRERRLLEQRAERQVWQQQQQKQKADIAARLLIEEEGQKKKEQRLPYLFTDTRSLQPQRPMRGHRQRKLRITRKLEQQLDGRASSAGAQLETSPRREVDSDDSDDDGQQLGDDNDRATMQASLAANEETETMAKPQFPGMWDTFKAYSIPKTEKVDHIRNGQASFMEQEIMRRVLEQTRANIVSKQVVAGREFKGEAFFSKPEVVHFKDFEVGGTYKQKVTLTNASYSVSSCKLVGMTDYLNNFIQIHFNPPGPLSAGMSCQLALTFSPKINEDLSGEVTFMCQTGQFAIPIMCTTKKCDLAIDKDCVDFGISVIGETLRQVVTLRNSGAKGCGFTLSKVDAFRQREKTEYSATEITEDPDEVQKLQQQQQQQQQPVDGKSPNTEGEMAVSSTVEADDNGGNGSTLIEQAGKEEMTSTDTELTDGMCVGRTADGVIGPFSEVKLEIVWSPVLSGNNSANFVLQFDDTASQQITFTSTGLAIDVPVWTDRRTVDMQVCMLDRLYQDTVLVNNRASTALKLHFQVPQQLQGHLELLPKTGYVQAHSQFSAQLKFLPRRSLPKDAAEFFDASTGVLEVPLTIRVADQTRPVEFTMLAVVTNSDLEFDVKQIDFDKCSIYESVTKTITLRNLSLLPQKFGFVGLPDFAEVQPNDGFGTILPNEVIELEVVFSPDRAAEFNFNLTCKSLIGRKFCISCSGIGVHPPLELSEQVVSFKATALHDFNDTMLYVVNSHTSMNEYSHPVPRIGKGAIAPVGATSFEFVLPSNAPFELSPSVGCVQPGQRARIHVRLKPHFTEAQVQQEASDLIRQKLEAEALAEQQRMMAEQQRMQEEAERMQLQSGSPAKGSRKSPKKDDKSKQAAAKGKGARGAMQPERRGGRGGAARDEAARAEAAELQVPAPDSILPDSDQFCAGQASLLRKFQGSFESFTVPCFVATGPCPTEPGTLAYAAENTLYLQVHCPIVSPKLAIISNSGRASLDFSNVSLGQTSVKSFTVQNISNSRLDLTSSLLDPNGAFALLNALRQLEPGQSHSVLIAFLPNRESNYHERLFLHAGSQKLGVTLRGRGILPKVACSAEGHLDLGAVLAGEYVERQLSLTNQSELTIPFSIRLDSASLLRHQEAQHLPAFAVTGRQHVLGVQNRSGQSVFDCVPTAGVIEPGQTFSLTVTFAPDHVSDCYSDGLRVLLFNQEEAHNLRLIGQAKPHIAFVGGGDAIRSEVETLAVSHRGQVQADAKAPVDSLLLTFGAVCAPDGTISPAYRTMHVGCVRTMAVSQKKNAEFTFENSNQVNALGFAIDCMKGQVEAGTKKQVTFTWTPPATQDPNVPVECSILMTLRGDVTELYQILLRAFVTSDASVVPSDTPATVTAAAGDDAASGQAGDDQ